MNIPVSRIAQQDTIRLVPSARLKAPVLSPLAKTPESLEKIASLESVTNSRLIGQEIGLPYLHPSELVYGIPYFTFINAAFTHVRPGGNRFNDERRGAWYCAFEIETAIKEVAFHLTRALSDVGHFKNITDYAELFADFIGEYHDLRHIKPVPDFLSEDVSAGYPAGQKLARELRVADSLGIVYPSVRNSGGTCLVSFVPHSVQNVRQGGLWRMEWDDSPTPVVTKDPRD